MTTPRDTKAALFDAAIDSVHDMDVTHRDHADANHREHLAQAMGVDVMNMTPQQIHWALVHYWSGDPRAEMGKERYDHQGKEMLPWMMENGLLDRDGYRTDKLTAYVEHLCAVQLPPHGN